MKSTTLILLAAVIAVAGRWVKHKTVDTEMVVGGVFLALTITFIAEANESFADKFAWLILLAVMGANADDLFKAVGLVTTTAAATANAHPSRIDSNGKPIPNSTSRPV